MATQLVTHHFGEVGSTQHEARILAESAGELPLLVLADRQTGGRGRAGHTWIAAPRALACSLAISPTWDPAEWGVISLVAGLAARRAVLAGFRIDAGLKWPNDLIVGDGKIAGILVETFGDVAVIGLGVNLWWPDPPDGIAALTSSDPGPDSAAALASAWSSDVLASMEGPARSWGHDEYRAACVTLSQHVSWDPGGSGRAVDISADGALVVDTDRGRVSLRSGEVHTVRRTTLSDDQGDASGGSAR